MRIPLYQSILTSLALLAAVGPANAYQSDDLGQRTVGEPVAVDVAVSLSEAVRLAEEAASGRAIAAEIESRQGANVYCVRVLKANRTEQEVLVDAQTGSLSIESKPD